MTASFDRNLLLGTTAILPPAALRAGARFERAEDYAAFLCETLAAPEPFYLALAAKLSWTSPPKGLGGPGAWFPGGTLSFATSVLDAGDRTKGAVWRYDEASGTAEAVSRVDLETRAKRVAAALGVWDLRRGDRVMIVLDDQVEVITAVLGVTMLGLTAVPTTSRNTHETLERRIELGACRALISRSSIESASRIKVGHRLDLDTPLPEPSTTKAASVEPMHPCLLLADSSGQIFTLPTAGFLVQALAAYTYLLDGRGAGDPLWIMTPTHHASSLSTAFGALAAGGEVGFIPAASAVSRASLERAVSVTRPRVLIANVKAIEQLISQGPQAQREARLEWPKLLIIEGENLEPRIFKQVQESLLAMDAHLVQNLARPESGGFVAGPHPSATPVRPSSVALAAPGLCVTVIEPNGTESEVSHGGLLALKHATPGLSRELQTLKGPIALEVKARKDKQGYLWTMGEAKVTRSLGGRVATSEIEALLASYEGVEQVAVVRYQPEGGKEHTRVFLKAEPHHTLSVAAIRAKAISRFGEEDAPDSYQVVERLPYSRSGKLLRSVLRRVCTGEPLGVEDTSLITDPSVLTELLAPRRDSVIPE